MTHNLWGNGLKSRCSVNHHENALKRQIVVVFHATACVYMSFFVHIFAVSLLYCVIFFPDIGCLEFLPSFSFVFVPICIDVAYCLKRIMRACIRSKHPVCGRGSGYCSYSSKALGQAGRFSFSFLKVFCLIDLYCMSDRKFNMLLMVTAEGRTNMASEQSPRH